jgi:putative transposase
VINTVKEQRPDVSIRKLCRLLAVNRSWYATKRRNQKASEDRRVALRDAIETIILKSISSGYRTVTKQLQREGWHVNHKRVLRIMRQESLLCRLKKLFRPIAPGSTQDAFPNLLKGADIARPDQAWQADITYIRLPQSFVYLATIIDSFSRRCIGWHVSRDIDTRLTLTALNQALENRQPIAGLIHHSDRGVQYASKAYVQRLKDANARISMSAAGNPYDNAKAESFFKTLKREEVYLNHYQNLEEARANIGRFIEDVYNTKRLHSSLGYCPPAEFEDNYEAARKC